MFDRIKHFLGIGGVDIELHIPQKISNTATTLEGTAKLTTRSDLTINTVTLKLVEEFIFVSGDGLEARTQKEHGQVVFSEPFKMKVGDQKVIPFTMTYRIPEPEEKTNASGLLVHRPGDYYVTVFVDVEETPTLFDPANRAAIAVV